jgi:leucyl-tRNA synthetase
MFLGPWDQGGDWSDSGINGMARWLNRVWDLAQRQPQEMDASPIDEAAERDFQRVLHKTTRRVTGDLDRFKFNTALAAMMEMTNAMGAAWEHRGIGGASWREAVERLLLLLAPIAPHVTEELWERTGHPYSIHAQSLPQWDESLAADEVITLVVQVNGKVRDQLEVPVDVPEEEAKQRALASQRVQGFTSGKEIRRLVYVPGRLVNIVVG